MFLKQFTFPLLKSPFYKTSFPLAFFSQSQSKVRQPSNAQDTLNHLNREKERIFTAEKELAAFSEFKEGLNFQQQGKYSIAQDRFKRVLDILEMSPLKGSEPHLHLLRKLSNNQLFVKDFKGTEKYLQTIADAVNTTKDEDQKYSHLDHLLQLYLHTNVEKAISLGTEVLSNKDKSKLPPLFHRQFLFDLGTAYLLNGNYSEAINAFKECIDLEPNSLLRGYALNNLALATWWQNFPEANKDKQTNSGSQEVISLFKDAIYNIEDVSSLQGGNKDLLEELLSVEGFTPKDTVRFDTGKVLITKKESLTPLLNIAKCLFELESEKIREGTFWAKYAIKGFESNDPENVYKVLITLANFYGETKAYIKSEGLFRRALELMENKNTYDKAICLQLYGQTLTRVTNRQFEGEKIIAEAKKVAEEFPNWAKRMSSVCLPDTEI